MASVDRRLAMAQGDARAERRWLSPGPLLVGVSVDSSPAVPAGAAAFADRLGVELVVLHVDESRVPLRTQEYGPVATVPIDPDLQDDVNEAASERVRRSVHEVLDGGPARWRWAERCGGASQALTQVAEEVDAVCIVIGAPHPGMLHTLQRLIEGSVESELARHQNRPVLVIPQPR